MQMKFSNQIQCTAAVHYCSEHISLQGCDTMSLGEHFPSVSKDRGFFMFRVKQSKQSSKCSSLVTEALGSFTTLYSYSPTDAVSHSSKSSACCCDFILTAVLPNYHFSENGYHIYWPEYNVSGTGP